MPVPGYLAMTPARIRSAPALPPRIGWMSCRFSPTGLHGLPRHLPKGSLLILDDGGDCPLTDPDAVVSQLRETAAALSLSGVLLDFQKPVEDPLFRLASRLCRELSCPVAVSQKYAEATHGPVFLDLIPPHRSLAAHIRPYAGRELWLELGPGAETVTVTSEGARFSAPRYPLPYCPFADLQLCCHYHLDLQEDRAVFTLLRQSGDLKALLQQGEDLGVTRYVGLFGDLPGLL